MTSDIMSEAEFQELVDFVTDRYDASGQAAEVVRVLVDHNTRILEFVDEIAEGESLNTADYLVFKTIAILHDAAKAETQLIEHAHGGADLAAGKLREMGKPEDFVLAVERAILCHMGPFAFIEEEARKYAERTGTELHFPHPQSYVEKLFFDADMLALMDIPGIEKVVVLRATTKEFLEEDLAEAAARRISPRQAAYESALASVGRAAADLFTDTARKIGLRLVAESEAHIGRQIAAEPHEPPEGPLA